MRQRLEALTVGPVPNRDAQIAGLKANVLDMLETGGMKVGRLCLNLKVIPACTSTQRRTGNSLPCQRRRRETPQAN